MLGRKACLRGSLLAAALSSTFLTSAWANTPTDMGAAVYGLLFDQAQMWRERDRPDLAAQALQKIIASQPENTQAHFQLGLLYLQNQELDKVRLTIAKLRQLDPADSRADELERAVRFGPPDKGLLAEARRLASGNALDQAVALYRRAFHGGPPPFEVALEFYETLAGTGAGWDEARLALKELADRNNEVRRIRFVYARTLTYSEQTRREGIGILASLCSDPALAQASLEAMRQAMLWMEILSGDRAFYESYLKRFPADTLVREKLAQSNRPIRQDPLALAIAEAYRLTDAGAQDQAAQRFEAIIQQNPSNADAIAGLGLVRLRQERFTESREQFLKAVALAPDRNADWAPSLESANFWASFRDAVAARDRNDNADAEKIARPLLERGASQDRLVVQLLMGDLMRRLGRQKEAEGFFRDALARDPANREALSGLAQILASQGRDIGKEPLLANLDRSVLSRLASESSQQNSERLRQQAKASERSSPQQAELAYQQSMQIDPSNVWARYDYAKFLTGIGRGTEATALVDGLASSQRGESMYAAAVFYSEQGRTGEAVAMMDRIPANQRSARMNTFRRDLGSAGELDQLIASAKAGDMSARVALIAKANAPQASSAQLASAALALAKVGLRPQAMATVMRVLPRNDLSIDTLQQLFYAASESGEERQAGEILARISRNSNGKVVEGMREGMAIRQADRLRESGNLTAAYDVLAPQVSGATPTVASRLALARVYKSSKYSDEAIKVLDSVMAGSALDIDTLQEAVGIALELRRLDRAQMWLAEAMRLQPQNPRLYVVQSRVLRAKGDNAGARKALEMAQELNSGRQTAVTPPPKPLNTETRSGELPRPTIRLSAATPNVVLASAAAPNTAAAAGIAPAAAPDSCDASAEADACSADEVAQLAPPYQSQKSGGVGGNGQQSRYSLVPLRRPGGSDAVTSTAPAAPSGSGTANDPLSREIEREMATLKKQTTPSIDAGLSFRGRSGEAGLGRLTEVSVPLNGYFPVGEGKLSAMITPVALNSGGGNADAGTLSRYGTNQLLAPAAQRTPLESGLTGVGLGLGFDWSMVHLDVGTTPIGFLVNNIVGGLSANIPLGESAQFKIEGSRRAVTDSLISYSGAKDPLTGRIWGGVVRSALEGTFGYDDGDIGGYGKFGYARYDGQNVPSNTSYEFTAGAYFRPVKDENSELKVGLSATYLSFGQNLGNYSFGQGGYFSPQSFYSLSFPVDWTEKAGKFKYNVGGTLGIQSIQKNRSAYFPNNPDLQTAANTVFATDPTRPAYYEAATETGLAYSFRAGLEYAMTEKTGLGAAVNFDSSKEFDQGKVMFFLRTTFN